MIKTSIEKLASGIGFDIGCSSNDVQADLLNGLCKGLSNSMNKQDKEMQLCYIVESLNAKTKDTLKEIVEFIKLSD